MFSSFFWSTAIQEDVKQSIIKNALNGNTQTVIELLETNKLDINNSNLIDECKQNLLHISIRSKNYDLAKYLVTKKIDKTKRNIFNETSYDIALKNNDLKMIEILLDVESSNYNRAEFNRLTNTVIEYQLNTKKLIDTNTELTHKNTLLHVQLNEVRTSTKRTKDDYDMCVSDNKRLRAENTQLKDDNKVLGDTVKSLRDAMKK